MDGGSPVAPAPPRPLVGEAVDPSPGAHADTAEEGWRQEEDPKGGRKTKRKPKARAKKIGGVAKESLLPPHPCPPAVEGDACDTGTLDKQDAERGTSGEPPCVAPRLESSAATGAATQESRDGDRRDVLRSLAVATLFRRLVGVSSCSDKLDAGALFVFAEMCGFGGSADDWKEECRAVAGGYGWRLDKGVDLDGFKRALEDTRGPAYCTTQEVLDKLSSMELDGLSDDCKADACLLFNALDTRGTGLLGMAELRALASARCFDGGDYHWAKHYEGLAEIYGWDPAQGVAIEGFIAMLGDRGFAWRCTGAELGSVVAAMGAAGPREMPPNWVSKATRTEYKFMPPGPHEVAAYLQAYGYRAADVDAWVDRPGSPDAPVLEVGVEGHLESHGHTWYVLLCSMDCGRFALQWRVRRRLVHFRERLHASIREQLAAMLYAEFFASAPFAMRGGVWGTTARLNTWCGAWAAAVNSGNVKPGLVALTCHFLDAPTGETCGRAAVVQTRAGKE